MAIDVDGSTTDTHDTVIDEINKRKGTNFTLRDFDQYDPEQSKLKMPIEEYLRYYEHVWKKRWQEIPLLASPELLRKIANTFNAVYLTNRGQSTRIPLLNYCEYHGIDVLPIISQDRLKDKAENNFDIYIDEHPDLATQIEKVEGKFLYLPKRPYNTEVKDSDKVKVVDTIDMALQDLLDMARS